MDVLWIGLLAFAGGVIAALLGWLESKVPFDVKKFGSSAIRALLAGFGFALAYNFQNFLTPLDLIAAFLGGAGVDVVGNRIGGALRKRKAGAP